MAEISLNQQHNTNFDSNIAIGKGCCLRGDDDDDEDTVIVSNHRSQTTLKNVRNMSIHFLFIVLLTTTFSKMQIFFKTKYGTIVVEKISREDQHEYHSRRQDHIQCRS